MKLFPLIAIFAVLSGCSTAPVEVVADIAVPVQCKLPVVETPVFLYPDCVKPTESIFALSQCLLSDVKKHIAYEMELSSAASACNF